MCKKLLVLFLVLGIASAASATNLWQAATGTGDWNVAANWNAGAVPNLTSDKASLCNTSISAAKVINITGAAATSKLQQKYDTNGIHLNVLSGGSLQVDGSYEMYQGDSDTVNNPPSVQTLNISNGATVDLCTKINTAYGTAKIGGANGNATINCDGTLNVVSTLESTLSLGNKAAPGQGRLNVGSTGVVTTDDLQFANDGYLEITKGGIVTIKGNELVEMLLARNAGDIAGVGGGGGTKITYNSGPDTTTITVPEPATIALLGLGGLLLRKRR